MHDTLPHRILAFLVEIKIILRKEKGPRKGMNACSADEKAI
jgi:hypothetical protein